MKRRQRYSKYSSRSGVSSGFHSLGIFSKATRQCRHRRLNPSSLFGLYLRRIDGIVHGLLLRLPTHRGFRPANMRLEWPTSQSVYFGVLRCTRGSMFGVPRWFLASDHDCRCCMATWRHDRAHSANGDSQQPRGITMQEFFWLLKSRCPS